MVFAHIDVHETFRGPGRVDMNVEVQLGQGLRAGQIDFIDGRQHFLIVGMRVLVGQHGIGTAEGMHAGIARGRGCLRLGGCKVRRRAFPGRDGYFGRVFRGGIQGAERLRRGRHGARGAPGRHARGGRMLHSRIALAHQDESQHHQIDAEQHPSATAQTGKRLRRVPPRVSIKPGTVCRCRSISDFLSASRMKDMKDSNRRAAHWAAAMANPVRPRPCPAPPGSALRRPHRH